MSFSKRIAVTAGFTKCHDTKDPGYMHNSRLYAQCKLTWEYKVTISSQLGYTLCIFYIIFLLGYTQCKFTVSFHCSYIRYKLHVKNTCLVTHNIYMHGY